jgi:hypothetical protein
MMTIAEIAAIAELVQIKAIPAISFLRETK